MPLDIAAPLLGGALLGLSASGLLLVSGRIAGVSGIIAGLLRPSQGEVLWRVLFVVGMVTAGLIASRVHPATFPVPVARSSVAFVAAGVLVGFGTRLGNGCTSGHGICGIGRLSVRSIAATVTFIITGIVTVFVSRYLLGAA